MSRSSRKPLVSGLLAAGLAYTLGFSASTLGEELPNEDDLQAAYCIVILRHSVDDLSTLVPAEVTDATKREIDETIKKFKFNFHQLRAYLAPRTQNLDILSIKEAQFRAEEDGSRGTQDAQICLKSCKDESCLKKCLDDSETSIRARKCHELTSLMLSNKVLATPPSTTPPAASNGKKHPM